MKAIIVIALAALTSCTSSKMKYAEGNIDVENSMENLTGLKVSQLGKNIRYVPLETTDSSLIGKRYMVNIHGNHIFVSTNKTCLVFDKQTGKYLRHIGHTGPGPQEYSTPECLIHPETSELYFRKLPNQLLKFNKEGQFLGEVQMPMNPSAPINLTFRGKQTLVHTGDGIGKAGSSHLVWRNEQGEVTDSLVQFSNPDAGMDEKGIDSAIRYICLQDYTSQPIGMMYVHLKNGKRRMVPMFSMSSVWSTDGKAHFHPVLSDTIYRIEGAKATPTLTFHTGKYHFPEAERGNAEGTEDYVGILSIWETPQRLFFLAKQDVYKDHIEANDRGLYYGLYNKETGSTTMNHAAQGLTDDLSHFLPFYPATTSPEGEYASLLEVGRMEEWLEEHPDTPKEGKLEFLKTLKEDDNPICVIVEP